ncbi:hypothetical protein ACM25N_08590 [Roseovarius sp. C7]|uniref:hypothetical protein n=1 Tax=Roseovarius sp. C7 TaxID=3398643 RepID=UPI0039F7280F
MGTGEDVLMRPFIGRGILTRQRSTDPMWGIAGDKSSLLSQGRKGRGGNLFKIEFNFISQPNGIARNETGWFKFQNQSFHLRPDEWQGRSRKEVPRDNSLFILIVYGNSGNTLIPMDMQNAQA